MHVQPPFLTVSLISAVFVDTNTVKMFKMIWHYRTFIGVDIVPQTAALARGIHVDIRLAIALYDILHSASGNSPIVESVVGRVRISEQQNRRSYRARRNEKSQPSPEPSLLHYTMHHDCKRNRA